MIQQFKLRTCVFSTRPEVICVVLMRYTQKSPDDWEGEYLTVDGWVPFSGFDILQVDKLPTVTSIEHQTEVR